MKVGPKRETLFSLEGDGVLENFYPFLWTKDPVFGTIPSVFIPETVVIKFDQPVAWYFMSQGLIRIKSKDNLKVENIKESFLRKIPPCGILCCFISINQKEDGSKERTFKYMNKEEFLTFIEAKHQLYTGILQKFVQPKGEYNSMIRAVWSRKLVFFEKRESHKKINNQKYDIYERVFTYEGEDFHSRIAPLRGYVVPNKLERICHNIAQHFMNITFEHMQIARMVLNFKIDSEERIWLLYCSSLRLEQGDYVAKDYPKQIKKANLGRFNLPQIYIPMDFNLDFKAPDDIQSNMMSTTHRPVNMHKEFTCMRCLNIFDKQHVYEVSYKTLIDGFEYNHLGNMQRSDEIRYADPSETEALAERISQLEKPLYGEKQTFKLNCHIPTVIKNIHPKMRDEAYRLLRLDLSFLGTVTTVCDNCMIEVGISKEGFLQTKYNVGELGRLGRGGLRPDILRDRNKATMLNIDVKRQVEAMDDKIAMSSPNELEKEKKIGEFKTKLIQLQKKSSIMEFDLGNDSDSFSELEKSQNDLQITRITSESKTLRATKTTKDEKTAREYKLSVNQRKIDLEKQLISKKFQEANTKKSKFLLDFSDNRKKSTPAIYMQSTPKVLSPSNKAKRNAVTRENAKPLDAGLAGFLTKRENSVAQISTKSTPRYFHTRQASIPDTTRTEGGDQFESSKKIESTQGASQNFLSKIPKIQYLKTFSSTKTSKLSIDPFDEYLVTSPRETPFSTPRTGADLMKHPFSLRHTRVNSFK